MDELLYVFLIIDRPAARFQHQKIQKEKNENEATQNNSKPMSTTQGTKMMRTNK